MILSDVNKQDNHLKTLVYGPPDAGKTTFAASGHASPGFGRTLIVNIEGGLQSIRTTTCMQTPLIRKSFEIDEVIQSVASRAKGFEDIGTVVIDSLTELQRIMLAEITARKHKAKPRAGGADETHIDDYRDLGSMINRYARMLRDLQCHVVATALLKPRSTIKDGPITSYTPDLSGSIDTSMRAIFDNVWCLQKVVASADGDATAGRPYVVMMTQATGLYVGKTRNAQFRELLPTIMKNPTMPDILSAFNKATKNT
jgi:hypothetical protein